MRPHNFAPFFQGTVNIAAATAGARAILVHSDPWCSGKVKREIGRESWTEKTDIKRSGIEKDRKNIFRKRERERKPNTQVGRERERFIDRKKGSY